MAAPIEAGKPPVQGAARPARAALWFGLGLYFNSALLLLATPIFTRLLSSEAYGQVVLYTSWAQVLTIFGTLSLSSGVFNNAMLDFPGETDGYMTSMLGLTLVSTLVTMAVMAVLMLVWRDVTTLGPTLLGFMGLQMFFNAAFLLWQAKERFQYRYKAVVGAGIAGSVLGVGGAMWLVPYLPQWQVQVRIMLPLLPPMIVGAIVLALLLMRSHRLYNPVYWRYALGISLTLIPHYGAQALLQQVDRFAVDAYVGRAAVGAYGLAAAVASGITLFWTAINTVWAPWMLRRLKAEDSAAVVPIATRIVAAVTLLSLAVMFAAPEIVRFLAPPSYGQAVLVLPWMLLTSVAQFAQSICLTVQLFHKRARWITAVSLLAAVWAVGLNVWLVPSLGIVSASVIATSSQLLLLVLHAALLRTAGYTLPLKMMPVLALLALGAACAELCRFLGDQLVLRAALLAASMLALGALAWQMRRLQRRRA
ncbi:lipopolysaccharide biosynthesis protein [Herbaspirillum huttiense]|uniref:lipopolysaccharide biosynthesis protein n=1 Tax=Herbaspirillum huttiense TaxID=863372 RepID=UPI0039B0BCC0